MANGYMQDTSDDMTTLGDVYKRDGRPQMAPVPWLEGRKIADPSDPLTQAIMKGKYVSAHLSAIRQAPPEQKQLAYTASRRDLANRGLLQPGGPDDPGPIFPGDEVIDQTRQGIDQHIRQLQRQRAGAPASTRGRSSGRRPMGASAQPIQMTSGQSTLPRNSPSSTVSAGQPDTTNMTRRRPDPAPERQSFARPDEPLQLIADHRAAIYDAAKRNGVSPEAIASVMYQEKYQGVLADAKDLLVEPNVRYFRRKFPKSWNPFTWHGDGLKEWYENSVGLAEMQVRTAANLMGKDLTDPKQADEVVAALHDDNRAIDLIAQYIAENQRAIGRKLTPLEAGMGHNAGAKGLKAYIQGRAGLLPIPARSKGHEQEIQRALHGDVTTPDPLLVQRPIPRP